MHVFEETPAGAVRRECEAVRSLAEAIGDCMIRLGLPQKEMARLLCGVAIDLAADRTVPEQPPESERA